TVTSRPRFQGTRSLTLIVASIAYAASSRSRATRRDPDKPARSFDRSGRVLVFDLLALGGSVAGFDRDPAWLHRFRHLAHQVDLQKPVLKRGALHLDVVCQA